MIRHLLAVAGIAVALLLSAPPATAQMSAAIGKPLPASDLENGTVTVRVVKGSMAEAVIGLDVSLIDGDGATKTARTDAEGRATFPKQTAGTTLTAKVKTDDGEVSSDSFTVPAAGGVRLMLSTVAWQDDAPSSAGAGAAAGQGMPNPRQMSGIARPEQADPAGQLTVKMVRGTMNDVLAGTDVLLVGYHANGNVRTLRQKTDAGGRAVFTGLDPRGAETYYAMALVTKPAPADGSLPAPPTTYDRLRSGPVNMLPGVGFRLLLAATPEGESAVDDLDRVETQTGAEAGVVKVRVRGAVTEGVKIELRSIDSGKVLATTHATTAEPTAATVAGKADAFVADPRMPDGVISVIVVRNRGKAPEAIPNVLVEARDANGTVISSAPTTQNGLATFGNLAVEPGAALTFKANVFGKEMVTAEIPYPAKGGGRVSFTTSWGDDGELAARFEGIATTDEALVAELNTNNQLYRSAPFQLGANGAIAGVLVFPRIVFRFHLGGQIDDAYMGFQGTMAIQNWSYAPYDPGNDGMLIPLPKGFIGAGVGEESSTKVGKDPDRGFIWRLPVPPGGADFTAGFSLPVVDGELSWDLALPYGAFDSNVTMLHTPGMRVELPPGVNGGLATSRTGMPIFAIEDITIVPNQRMVMAIHGLPHQPSWQRWVRIAVGMVVVIFFVLTIVIVVVWRRGQTAVIARETVREGLLDKLVTLEREHVSGAVADTAYQQQKTKLRREIEHLHDGKAKG